MKIFISKKIINNLLGIFVLLFIWWYASRTVGSDEILPSPRLTFLAVLEVFSQPGFFTSIAATIGRGLTGFLIAILIAAAIGIPAGIYPGFFSFINPLITSVRSTPVISIILLAIIWFGNEQVPVFIAVLTMFPILTLNLVEGIKSVDVNFIVLSKSYRIPFFRILTGVYLPSVAPFLTSGVSNALGFGWRAVIIGEVLSQPSSGIGTRMQESQIFLLVGELIAWTLIAVIISYFFETAVRKLEKSLIKWKKA